MCSQAFPVWNTTFHYEEYFISWTYSYPYTATATKGNRLYLRSGLSLIEQVSSSSNAFGLHSEIILNLGLDNIFPDCFYGSLQSP